MGAGAGVNEAIAGWVLYVLICTLLTVAIVGVALIVLDEAEKRWR